MTHPESHALLLFLEIRIDDIVILLVRSCGGCIARGLLSTSLLAVHLLGHIIGSLFQGIQLSLQTIHIILVNGSLEFISELLDFILLLLADVRIIGLEGFINLVDVGFRLVLGLDIFLTLVIFSLMFLSFLDHTVDFIFRQTGRILDGNGLFLVGSLIDCTDIEWTPIGTMDLEDMSNHDCMFQGVFDGNGHTISNVTFDSDTPICGAGIIGMNLGEVKNLTAKNINIHCTDTYSMAIGGVVGYNMGEIHDVTLTGENEIAGVNAIGGITGGSTNHVHDCTVDGTTIRVLGDNDFSDGRIIQCDVAECGGLIIGGSFGGTIENCTAKGKIIAEGNEPVGMGGIAGCLEMMDSVTDCTADVEIISAKGGHAIGGLCGYSGTHSVGDIALATEGVESHAYPGIIKNCSVTVKMNVPGATHVGGLIGTGLYYYGEETAFRIVDCSVKAEITGAVTPGAVAGRAENSVIESCKAEVTLDGAELTDEIGKTDKMYESADQEGAEEAEGTQEAEKKDAA